MRHSEAILDVLEASLDLRQPVAKRQLVGLLEQVVDLWKSGYEPSTSVLLQRAWGEAV